MGEKEKVTIGLKNTKQYVQFWNGILKLTDREVGILAELMDGEGELGDTENRAYVCASLGLSKEVMNTYIKRLKDKKALQYEKLTKTYKLNNLLRGGKVVEVALHRAS